MPPLTSMEVEFTENRIIDLIDFLVDEVNRRLELDYQGNVYFHLRPCGVQGLFKSKPVIRQRFQLPLAYIET